MESTLKGRGKLLHKFPSLAPKKPSETRRRRVMEAIKLSVTQANWHSVHFSHRFRLNLSTSSRLHTRTQAEKSRDLHCGNVKFQDSHRAIMRVRDIKKAELRRQG
jgi:hypothetical protein